LTDNSASDDELVVSLTVFGDGTGSVSVQEGGGRGRLATAAVINIAAPITNIASPTI
jgi:hypothetical protein